MKTWGTPHNLPLGRGPYCVFDATNFNRPLLQMTLLKSHEVSKILRRTNINYIPPSHRPPADRWRTGMGGGSIDSPPLPPLHGSTWAAGGERRGCCRRLPSPARPVASRWALRILVQWRWLQWERRGCRQSVGQGCPGLRPLLAWPSTLPARQRQVHLRSGCGGSDAAAGSGGDPPLRTKASVLASAMRRRLLSAPSSTSAGLARHQPVVGI